MARCSFYVQLFVVWLTTSALAKALPLPGTLPDAEVMFAMETADPPATSTPSPILLQFKGNAHVSSVYTLQSAETTTQDGSQAETSDSNPENPRIEAAPQVTTEEAPTSSDTPLDKFHPRVSHVDKLPVERNSTIEAGHSDSQSESQTSVDSLSLLNSTDTLSPSHEHLGTVQIVNVTQGSHANNSPSSSTEGEYLITHDSDSLPHLKASDRTELNSEIAKDSVAATTVDSWSTASVTEEATTIFPDFPKTVALGNSTVASGNEDVYEKPISASTAESLDASTDSTGLTSAPAVKLEGTVRPTESVDELRVREQTQLDNHEARSLGGSLTTEVSVASATLLTDVSETMTDATDEHPTPEPATTTVLPVEHSPLPNKTSHPDQLDKSGDVVSNIVTTEDPLTPTEEIPLPTRAALDSSSRGSRVLAGDAIDETSTNAFASDLASATTTPKPAQSSITTSVPETTEYNSQETHTASTSKEYTEAATTPADEVNPEETTTAQQPSSTITPLANQNMDDPNNGTQTEVNTHTEPTSSQTPTLSSPAGNPEMPPTTQDPESKPPGAAYDSEVIHIHPSTEDDKPLAHDNNEINATATPTEPREIMSETHTTVASPADSGTWLSPENTLVSSPSSASLESGVSSDPVAREEVTTTGTGKSIDCPPDPEHQGELRYFIVLGLTGCSVATTLLVLALLVVKLHAGVKNPSPSFDLCGCLSRTRRAEITPRRAEVTGKPKLRPGRHLASDADCRAGEDVPLAGVGVKTASSQSCKPPQSTPVVPNGAPKTAPVPAGNSPV